MRNRIVIWSSYSFEDSYAEYHIMSDRIRAFLESGFEVILIQKSFHNGDKLPLVLAHETNIKTIDISFCQPQKTSFIKRYFYELHYYTKSIKYACKYDSAVFIQSSFAAWFPILLLKISKPRQRIIYNVQDIFPDDALASGKMQERSLEYKILKRLQKYAYMSSDLIITISDDLKTTIEKDTEHKKTIDVIYNWSYQNTPLNISDENNHFLKSNDIKRTDGFRVIYAGNIGQMIDYEMIVQVAKRVSIYGDIKFYIIGEGSALQAFKESVKRARLSNIEFYGFQPMQFAQDNYCAADVIINAVPKGVIYTCMPSKTAMCLLSERPTVVSLDLESDMSKRLSTIDQWYVVAPGDSHAMAEAIVKIYKEGSNKSNNAIEFLNELAPVENAKEYVSCLNKMLES